MPCEAGRRCSATWASPAERLSERGSGRAARLARPAGHCREQQEQLVSQQSPARPARMLMRRPGRTKPRSRGSDPGARESRARARPTPRRPLYEWHRRWHRQPANRSAAETLPALLFTDPFVTKPKQKQPQEAPSASGNSQKSFRKTQRSFSYVHLLKVNGGKQQNHQKLP